MAVPLQRQTSDLHVRGRGGKQHYPPECQRQKMITQLESTFASHHRGAAASFLDQSELHGGSITKANACRCIVAAASGTLHPSARVRRRPRTLHSATPRTLTQLQACSTSRSSMAAPLQRQTHDLQLRGRGGKHSSPECQRQKATTHLGFASAQQQSGAAASLLH